jgi:hypothetical protein
MNIDIDEEDCIVVETKGSEVGKRSAGLAGSSDPADAGAGAPSSEAGKRAVDEGGGWTRVTRQRAKGNSRASTSEPAAKAAKVFTAAGELNRKRKAEEGTTEQVAQLKELVYRLLRSYDEHKATQESQQKDLAATIEAQTRTIAKLEATVQGQATELREVRTLLQADKPSRQSYSDALHRVPSPANSTSTARTLVDKAVPQGTPRERRLNEDKTAITVNTTRVKKEKQDTTVMRDTLNRSLKSFRVTEDVAIEYIRLRPTDSADLVFSSAKDRDRAREHPRWLTAAMPEARMRGEQWYPVKCDCVAKNAVMDFDKDDGKTLRSGVLSEFKEQNSTDTTDCTAMKVAWLSKRQSEKRVGSLVIWLKTPAAAEHLLQQGFARFGASGAFCSKFEQKESLDLCYNCNRYGHKQVNCSHQTKCGICSNPHNTRNCSQRDSPRCPACKGDHPIFDRKCKFHPKHAPEKPKFGPTLPPAMAKEKLAKERRIKEKAIEERRKEQREADENMVDA